jgi:hypothetical protein
MGRRRRLVLKGRLHPSPARIAPQGPKVLANRPFGAGRRNVDEWKRMFIREAFGNTTRARNPAPLKLAPKRLVGWAGM